MRESLMKLQKFLIAGLLVTAFSGLSAGASQALSCAVGFEPKDGHSMTECVAIEPVEATAYTTEEVEAIEFTAEDGEVVDPEITLYSEETPAIDENGCWTQTDADGNSVDVCAKGVGITPINAEVDPSFGCGTVTDENGVDMEVCDAAILPGAEMYQTGVPEMRNDVELTSAGGSNGSDSSSNTLAALGVLIAAAGAFGIGLSRQRAAKK
jgi:hypothetical protein